MRTFAEKPRVTQQNTSAGTTNPGKAHFGEDAEASWISRSHRTIGNQAVLRLLEANTKDVTRDGSGTSNIARFGDDFSKTPLCAKAPRTIQTKLTFSSPGDIYEQEADRVAEQVLHIPEPQVERVCPCGGGCPRCQAEQPGHQHEGL